MEIKAPAEGHVLQPLAIKHGEPRFISNLKALSAAESGEMSKEERWHKNSLHFGSTAFLPQGQVAVQLLKMLAIHTNHANSDDHCLPGKS